MIAPGLRSTLGRGHRVVDRRVAEGAGDADRLQAAAAHLSRDAEDRVEADQLHGGCRVVQVVRRQEPWRECGRVDLEADAESRHRAHRRLDDLVQVQRVRPELLVAVGVEAEDRLAVHGLRAGGGPGDRHADRQDQSERRAHWALEEAKSGKPPPI
jgi:hypothetical protein